MKYKIFKYKGVHGYVDEKEKVWLNVDDVAKELNMITFDKNGKTCSNMEFVNHMLTEFNNDLVNLKETDYIDTATIVFLASKMPKNLTKNTTKDLFNEVVYKIKEAGMPSTTVMYLKEKVTDNSDEINVLHQKIIDLEKEQEMMQNYFYIFSPVYGTKSDSEKFNVLMLQYAKTFPEFLKRKKIALDKATNIFLETFKKTIGIDLKRRAKNARNKYNNQKYSEINVLEDFKKGKFLPIALNIIQGLIVSKKGES